MLRQASALLSCALFVSGCLAPPPPIVVDTPFGEVRASSRGKATEVAQLLERLAPEVRALLPGAQERSIDVWVQEKLAVYRFHQRPESVRGFTLLEDEFEAKRIHLQEGGQSPWYLSHELVHALIGPTWAPLPGILEEGLGDVVAETLNPEYQNHIRSHRLLNASAFTGGLALDLVYGTRRRGPLPPTHVSARLDFSDPVDPHVLGRLLATPRSELHQRWADIPESFYGISWLIVSRIVERIGMDGLHGLCLRATAEGRSLVPLEWIERAADMDMGRLDPVFLASCFDRPTLQTALYLRPEPFADALLAALEPLNGQGSFREVVRATRPVILLGDGSEVPLSYYLGPLYASLGGGWPMPAAAPR